MNISLIDNGLDSLKKGFEFLKNYEELKKSSASDAARFSALKDAVLSIQHGIEILFKYLLKEKNEVLLFSEINIKLKQAYQSRKKGEISELYEMDGVHTVGFRESIERVSDILGIDVNDKFRKILFKLEKWRNGIIHSAVFLNEQEVSNVLFDAMERLDEFFGPAIGEKYQSGQGRQDLDRAYRLFKAIHGNHKSSVKDGVVERLVAALSKNGINVTSPGIFVIKDADVAFSVLQSMQGDSATYGCDLINMHCSGRAYVTGLAGKEITIFSEDNRAYYRFIFSGLLVFVPEINDNISPLIFLYSKTSRAIGSDARINSFRGFDTQEGIHLIESGEEIWSNDECLKLLYGDGEDGSNINHRGIFRFLSAGMICFMNIQLLSHGQAKKFLYGRKFGNIEDLRMVFEEYIANQKITS